MIFLTAMTFILNAYVFVGLSLSNFFYNTFTHVPGNAFFYDICNEKDPKMHEEQTKCIWAFIVQNTNYGFFWKSRI